MALTDAQKRAKKKYYEKNKESQTLQASMRSARFFIRKTDELEKLIELKDLINDRIQEISINQKKME